MSFRAASLRAAAFQLGRDKYFSVWYRTMRMTWRSIMRIDTSASMKHYEIELHSKALMISAAFAGVLTAQFTCIVRH